LNWGKAKKKMGNEGREIQSTNVRGLHWKGFQEERMGTNNFRKRSNGKGQWRREEKEGKRENAKNTRARHNSVQPKKGAENKGDREAFTEIRRIENRTF